MAARRDRADPTAPSRNSVVDDPADGWFPESAATTYDAPGGANAPEVVLPALQLLEALADGGPALELAVGTGRIPAPLACRGLSLSGIELSRAMAARIADKPGGERVAVTISDMTTARVAGEFSLVSLAFNTICNVLTQADEAEVFANAAAHLRPAGRLLIEVGVPDLRRLPPGQDAVPFALGIGPGGTSGSAGIESCDVVHQTFTSTHITVSPGGASRFRTTPSASAGRASST